MKQTVEEWGSGITDAAGLMGGFTTAEMRRAVVRITELTSTSFKTGNVSSQTCDGDSGGPLFAGPSDLIVGIHRSRSAGTGCATPGSTATQHRITPAVIDFINNHRQGSDPACRETIAGTGFYACS